MEPRITHKTPRAELELAAMELGKILKAKLDDKGYSALCEDLINGGILERLGEFIRIMNRPLEELKEDKRNLFMALNAKYYIDALSIAFRTMGCVNARVLLDNPYTESLPPDKYPERICKDISSFCAWAILKGGPSNLVRERVASKSLKEIPKVEREFGKDAFLSLIVRTEIAFRVFCEKILIPAGRKHLPKKESVPIVTNTESEKFNSLASAFKSIKKK